MLNHVFIQQIEEQLAKTRQSGTFKMEHPISSPQQPNLQIKHDQATINLCANNYLGLANHPRLIEAAKEGLHRYGYGMASVRFICGTQTIHQELEQKLSLFLGMEDTILYASCFDANAGLFETLLSSEDAIISDALNHASIIDGIRLSKAKRYRYQNRDMNDLEQCLIQAKANHARHLLIVTDGVFSMDGSIAKLKEVCDLADEYQALVMVDDSHATGFIGVDGRGTHEHCDVMNRVDIITGTLGKALGGAAGGFTSANQAIIAWLRQRSRPYLFSNSLAPMLVCGALAALELLQEDAQLKIQLAQNAALFRHKMTKAGFLLAGADHPIIPVMIGDEKKAADLATRLQQDGIYVVAFSYPVVPKDQARIRVQISAAHTKDQLESAVHAFIQHGHALKIID